MTLLEVPPEPADGVRTDFTTSNGIAPDSTSALIRGMRRRITDSNFGWTVIPPNTFRFNTAPPTGTPVILSYRTR